MSVKNSQEWSNVVKRCQTSSVDYGHGDEGGLKNVSRGRIFKTDLVNDAALLRISITVREKSGLVLFRV